PNHHALAQQWTVGDNFYTDSDVSVDGHHWLVGAPPTIWTQSSLMAGYSEAKKYFRLGDAPGRHLFAGTDASVHPEERWENGKTGQELPRFLFIHLPNDHMDAARPTDGYPYRESYVGDNDLALGRIVEYLSGTKWWKEMAIFVTEDDAQGGVDHIDAHRTVFM